MTTATHVHSASLSKKYIGKSGGKSFNADDLISAWEQGKVCGKNEIFELVIKERKQNTQKAINFCRESFNLLKSKKINCGAIFLNDELINDMFTLIIVDEKDYVKDSFLGIIKDIDALLEKKGDNLFNVHYKIMPFYSHIDEDVIVADGYTVLYDGEKVKIHRSRQP